MIKYGRTNSIICCFVYDDIKAWPFWGERKRFMKTKKRIKKALSLLVAVSLAAGTPVTMQAATTKFTAKKVVMVKGESKTLKVVGGKAKNWTSSKKSVATVNSKGKVTAKKKGTTTIKCKVSKKTLKCTVKVEEPALSKKSLTLGAGEAYRLTVSGTTLKVSWSSSNSSVATVSSTGLVRAKNVQVASNVTIKAVINKKVLNCQVTVKPMATPEPTVTVPPTEAPQTTATVPPTEAPQATETVPPTEAPQATDTVQPSVAPTETPSQPVSDKVEWTVTEEKFMGAYSSKNDETGETENIPKELTRKYVSFNPWPTTNEQVEYVIKNCDDPYVIGALYIVALDNFEYNGLGKYDAEVYKMLNTLMSGAGTVTGTNYQLSNYAKQTICGFGNKQVVKADGTAVNVSTFASRAYLKGATPYNNYTPEGGLEDKTKWQIVMDEYVYCGDLANGYITVCPQRYTEAEETEGNRTVVEHWQGIRIGFRWNKTAKVWLPTENTALNNPPTGPLEPFNVDKQVLFSSNYMAPVDDQGW